VLINKPKFKKELDMYKIIRFTPQSQWYYPSNVDYFIDDYYENTRNYIAHTDVDFAIGTSRVGGAIVDLPEFLEYPENMCLAAQLDLSQFSPFDPFDLLPKKGFLYFFIRKDDEAGKVIFIDVEADELKRIIREHDRWFANGCLVDKIFNEEESFYSRFCNEEDDELEDEEELENGEIYWDYSAGSEKSKIYGIYTHCQKHEEEIRRITDSNDILLLQIGEDFTDEGVWSVLIDRESLVNREFENCKFEWGQS
jgi:uncharacterized protein YwqG